MYIPSKPNARSTNVTIASEKEANASALCKDDSSEKGQIAGYRTKNIPDKAREMAARRIRSTFMDF
jgi:hypothetical protein